LDDFSGGADDGARVGSRVVGPVMRGGNGR
jgi:hypothetical protein